MKKMNLILFVLIVAAVIVIVRYKMRGRAPAESASMQPPAAWQTPAPNENPTINATTTATEENPTISAPTQNQSTSTPTSVKNGQYLVTVKTNFGAIQFETFDADAPKTVANFIALTYKGFYDNLTFHRIIKGFMIQGGDPNHDGSGGPGYQFADELNPETESYKAGYVKGAVAMANAGPNTNGSQFFIMLADYPLPRNYTIFGKVASGQETVDKIGNEKTGANDKPLNPVIMEKITVLKK